jgi:precorrin-2 dehydrogenase/sirohydrochlorin ferrochelatase
MSGYPICLNNLNRSACVVVGGGQVAERKVLSLLGAHAVTKVISPRLTGTLRQLAERGTIEHIARPYRPGDLDGAFLVIAATDDPDTNRAVTEEAEMRQILVNVVDDPLLGNFTLPAVLRQGSVTVSISTGGQSPALAAHIRDRLQPHVGPEYGALAELLGEAREWVNKLCPADCRRDLWHRLVRSDMLELLREGKEDEARDEAKRIVAEHSSPMHPNRG